MEQLLLPGGERTSGIMVGGVGNTTVGAEDKVDKRGQLAASGIVIDEGTV